jgi:3-hydroxyisobutyrate dehydrogenase-like beta-hydroxyacid dehydrogenase
MLKDVEMIAKAARESGTSMPVGAAVGDVLRAAVHLGLGEADLSRVTEVYEAR